MDCCAVFDQWLTIEYRIRAWLAGYPDLFFSFHSLRSGYLVNNLLQAYGNNAELQTAMIESAWIAQWVPFSKSM